MSDDWPEHAQRVHLLQDIEGRRRQSAAFLLLLNDSARTRVVPSTSETQRQLGMSDTVSRELAAEE